MTGTRAAAVLASLAAAATLAGCGGSSTGASAAASIAPTATASATASATPSGGPALETHTSSYGQILTTGSGQVLYLFTADTPAKFGCAGAPCTAVWEPFLASSQPTLGPGVQASLVGTRTRPGGAKQLTYAGHPLYTFLPGGIAKTLFGTGAAPGEGRSSFGGTWYVVSASTGKAVTTSASPTPSASA